MRSSARPERTARGVAFRVLVRVASDGAFAAMALDAELVRARLSDRDARLATAIVYGTLRQLDAIDRVIAAQLTRAGGLDASARAALRASVHQLGALDRQPAHAVVDEAVTWVRNERGPRVAGFVNAVLRKIAARGLRLEDGESALDPAIVERLRRSLGDARAAAFQARRGTPSIDLRVRGDRDALVTRLRAALPEARIEPARFSPSGVRTLRAGDPRKLPGAEEGDFVVQEEGSQLVGRWLGAREGERVLDVCAGRGGKTTWLGEAVGATGAVVATDLHEHRLAQIAPVFAHLGLRAELETIAIDWTVGNGGLEATFDRVLVDAPCSGLGTLHRRPEIAARLTPAAIAELAAIQRAIVLRAAGCVRPGGTLLYAVCSPLDEESRDVVVGLPSMQPAPFRADEAFGVPVDADGSIALGPFLDDAGPGTDGYRIFRFVRV